MKPSSGIGPFNLNRVANRLPTGSDALDSLIGGGIPTSALTDVFGAAGTGKTQFAFQCSILACQGELKKSPKPRVAYVDCSGSLRPERIVEMAEERKVAEPSSILDSIFAISVRSVSQQVVAAERILSDGEFSQCNLVVVDDVTSNFISEYGTSESDIISRQHNLALYARKLAYTAVSRNIAVLITNSARSSFEAGEVETTGSLLSQFALFRIRFRNVNGQRSAEILQPHRDRRERVFEIKGRGLVP